MRKTVATDRTADDRILDAIVALSAKMGERVAAIDALLEAQIAVSTAAERAITVLAVRMDLLEEWARERFEELRRDK